MKKGITLFIFGLVMFGLGIYLSKMWVVIGTLLGVFGGMVMGSSTYIMSKKEPNQTER